MSSMWMLLPLAAFLAVAVALAFAVRKPSRARNDADGTGFIGDYFIGNRSLSGFVLAMTTVATYGSVSSFVGGPGQAWEIGFGWVYMATVQVTALILLYGILGKKMALVSRRIGAVTVVDVIRARYRSDALASLSAIVIVLFFCTTMVAQFVGGAKLFEMVTGFSYEAGIFVFGLTAVLFTVIGGFRGVAFTDALCGIMMLVGIVALAFGILSAGGGYANIMESISATKPELLDPLSGGDMPISLYFTQWLLVGVFTFCLPQSVIRCAGAKDVRSMNRAMVIGTIVIGFIMIGVTSLGVLAAGVLPGALSAYGGSVDNIIPVAIAKFLSPPVAGVAIIGPVAASISTVSSLLIASSSAIVKDLWLHWRRKHERLGSEKDLSLSSHVVTLVLGVLVLLLSIVPPDVIWKINMFAFGGLETAFCWVLVAGFFWKRANATGALFSMGGGVSAYCICMYAGIVFFGMHQIVIGISVSAVLMVVGSLVSKPMSECELECFFPRDGY